MKFTKEQFKKAKATALTFLNNHSEILKVKKLQKESEMRELWILQRIERREYHVQA